MKHRDVAKAESVGKTALVEEVQQGTWFKKINLANIVKSL
jgi:hypothetical protein